MLLPLLHILSSVIIFFGFAVLASALARKAGINLKEMAGRNAPQLLWIGAAANLGALSSILILIRFLDLKPISAIGLSFQPKDVHFSLIAVTGTVGLAVAYIIRFHRRGRFHVTRHKSIQDEAGVLHLLAGLLVLLIVALQEEVLYRGYIFLNLSQFGSAVFLVGSTLIFVLIHFLTNRVNLRQILSWLLSGLVLAVAYLISGSIWGPIILHFAIDATNVLVFNITGQHSFFTILPSLTERDRKPYRLIYGFAMLTTILSIYGLPFGLA